MYLKRNAIIANDLDIEGLVDAVFTSAVCRINWYKRRIGFYKTVNIPGIICIDSCYFNKKVMIDEDGKEINVIETIFDNGEIETTAINSGLFI